MALLTQVVKRTDGNRRPLMLEVPVSRDLDGPFLVTSTRGVLWIAKTFPNGSVRIAVRTTGLSALFREIVRSIASESAENDWGSVQSPTEGGVKAAVEHLADYDFFDVEVFYGDGFDPEIVDDDIPIHEVDWLPRGWAVALPADRAFVGTTLDFGGGQYASLIHNASRGVAVLVPENGIQEEVSLRALVQEGHLPAAVKGLYSTNVKNRKSGLAPLYTLDQLIGSSRSQLLRYKGVGPRTVDALESFLGERELSLAEE
jgi:hypothetical protein